MDNCIKSAKSPLRIYLVYFISKLQLFTKTQSIYKYSTEMTPLDQTYSDTEEKFEVYSLFSEIWSHGYGKIYYTIYNF